MEYSEVNLKKLKVTDLKSELTKNSLPLTGKKEELIARLIMFSKGKKDSPAPASTLTAPRASLPAVATAQAPPSKPTPASPNSTLPSKPAAPLKTEEEKLKERALRFGIPDKNQVKSTASNIPANVIAKSPSAASPGTAPPGTASVHMLKNESVDALVKRQERFGIVNPNLEKVVKLSQEEELKRKRLERFGMEDNGKKTKV